MILDELSGLFDTTQKLTIVSVRLLLGSGAPPNQCNNRNRYLRPTVIDKELAN